LFDFSAGGTVVSLIRVGLAETKGFSEGYDAIFGKKKEEPEKSATNKSKDETAEKKEEPKQK
jgi:hypothetical protein